MKLGFIKYALCGSLIVSTAMASNVGGDDGVNKQLTSLTARVELLEKQVAYHTASFGSLEKVQSVEPKKNAGLSVEQLDRKELETLMKSLADQNQKLLRWLSCIKTGQEKVREESGSLGRGAQDILATVYSDSANKTEDMVQQFKTLQMLGEKLGIKVQEDPELTRRFMSYGGRPPENPDFNAYIEQSRQRQVPPPSRRK